MCTAPDAVMLFAAGFGTRMGALTADRPKPLIRVAGRALLDHALEMAEGAGAAPIVVNAHYKASQIAAHLAGRDAAISHEAPDILDTGGGLRAALPMLKASAICTMNTDAVWRGANALSLLRDAWRPDVMDALLLCVPLARAVGHKGQGDFTLGADGRLTRGGGLIYSGAQIIKASALEDMPLGAFSLNLVWDRLLAAGRLHGCIYPGTWCDVGHPAGIALAEEMLGAPDV